MGLDMYLYRDTYVKNWDHTPPERRTEITIRTGGEIRDDINLALVSNIVEHVGYWRKANSIHGWFVRNVQDGKDDCQRAYVNREQLAGLLVTCKRIIADPDPAMIMAELPPTTGFFFGGTGMETAEDIEYILSDLRHTVAILEPIMARADDHADYYYQSSW